MMLSYLPKIGMDNLAVTGVNVHLMMMVEIL